MSRPILYFPMVLDVCCSSQGDGCRQHPYKCEKCADRKCPRLRLLGTQQYSLKEKNQDKEIQRRIMAGWAAYAKYRDIFKSNLAICLKRHVYNSCELPAMTNGAETWTPTKQAQNKLAAAPTKMERSMLNITYKDRKTNVWFTERTKVIDIINTVRIMKWS